MTKPVKPEPAKLRPSEFMRARRPQLFSDSKTRPGIRLPQAVLEYHLDTLTNRKQEQEFEYFCRQIAEKELCPNLLPQTGPTGGGDSKVDAETYPVADSIAETWYEGIGREPAQERWAFAFSAKKDWAAKVKADVKKICGTGRDYRLVYFVTNQFVPDKKRAETEDQLTKASGVSVRILDRSWIVDRVFKGGREQLAVSALKIAGYEDVSERVPGPQDTKRRQELDELERQIGDPARYSGVRYQFGEDCLRAALLARNLELPRVEVEGRFDRAVRITESTGHRQQRLRVFYYRAWTAFWWYEDFEQLNHLYDQVEALAVGSEQANDLELLANLWNLISGAVAHAHLDAARSKREYRRATLTAELDRMAAITTRPNNALQARSIRLLIDVTTAVGAGGQVDTVLRELQGVVRSAEGLGTFPIEPLANMLREMGELLVDNRAYDELLESIVDLVARRKSEGASGEVLVERGLQKLNAGRRYDAIRLLGRAQTKLVMHEYRGELIQALAACGSAYEAAGLLWAARANALAAANHAFSEFWESGRITTPALRCVQRLVWLEIQLGRVPHVLAWMEVAGSVAASLALEGKRKEAFLEERQAQDFVLGILLLRTGMWDLRSLASVPRVFEEQGLAHSWMTLLYALGHEDYLRREGAIPEAEGPDAIGTIFAELLAHPSNEDLPAEPEFLLESKVVLRSFVLGCTVEVVAVNDLQSVQLSETILGVLEALLATSLSGEMAPYRSELRITVTPSDFLQGLPEYKLERVEGAPVFAIRHPSPMTLATPDDRRTFKDWLVELVAHIIPQVAVIRDPESHLTRLARDEGGFARALGISDVAICERNILGDKPRLRMSDWEGKEKGIEFPLRRDVAWNAGLERPLAERDEGKVLQPGVGEPPDELFGIDHLKHRDRRVLSLIDIPLWEEAKWRGTLFMWPIGTDLPPLLALMFENEGAARDIFQGLRKQLGEADAGRRLRVSIVTGVDKHHPAHYCVVVGNPLPAAGVSRPAQFVMVSRINRMTPDDSRNLENFLAQFSRAGRYFVGAAYLTKSGPPKVIGTLVIEKDDLNVRPAWEIGENDPDASALHDDDEPIIPDGVENPPVLKALEQIRQFRARRGS